jgi:hypothetical protein
MSATAVQPLFDLFATERRRSAEPRLGEWIGEVWADLLRSGTAECPVCHGQMERAGEGGCCTRCGSVLS